MSNVIRLASIFSLTLGFAAAASAEPLFKYKGNTYDTSKLDAKYQSLLYEFEAETFKKKEQLAEEIMLDSYFQEEATKQKKTVEQVKEAALSTKEPTEAELKKFYEENKARIPYPFDQVKADLGRYMKQQKGGEKQAELIKKLKKDGKFELAIKEPVAPVLAMNLDGFAVRGNDKAKVKVVEFADYKCGHCAEASKEFKELYKKYESKVQFYFVDFPILGGLSEKLAEGAACANQQGKFWEYNKLAYEIQAETKESSPGEMAKKIGADQKKFDECMAKGAGRDAVVRGKAEGSKLGIQGTPTIFINGKKTHVAPTAEALGGEIEKALKEHGAS